MSVRLPFRVVLKRIGKPIYQKHRALTRSLETPSAIIKFWKSVIATQPDYEPDKEHLVAIFVTVRFRPLGFHVVAVGNLTECIAHPREIFRPAIVAGAYAFTLAHNHPSGDPTPSCADHVLTIRLRDAAEVLQVKMLDHVIVGALKEKSAAFYSFKEAGIL